MRSVAFSQKFSNKIGVDSVYEDPPLLVSIFITR